MKHSRISLALASAAMLLAAIRPVSAATIGDIIRATYTNPYLLNGGDSRLAFPDTETVVTWGSPVAKEVPGETLPRWSLSGAIPLREGSRLVKFGTDPYVYAVGPAGTLYWITKPSLAAELYGADWQRRVVTLFSSYYPNYRMAAAVVEPVHPAGTIFKYPDASAVYYLTSSGTARPFQSESAFKVNRFSFDGVIAVPRTFKYVLGNPIVGFENDLNLIARRS